MRYLLWIKNHRLRWDSNPQPPNNYFTTRSPTRYPLRHGDDGYLPGLGIFKFKDTNFANEISFVN